MLTAFMAWMALENTRIATGCSGIEMASLTSWGSVAGKVALEEALVVSLMVEEFEGREELVKERIALIPCKLR